MSVKLTGPAKVGAAFGTIGLLLTVVGILRGNVPLNPASIGVALLIGGGVWFVVACRRCRPGFGRSGIGNGRIKHYFHRDYFFWESRSRASMEVRVKRSNGEFYGK
jgi:hypothetical protein